MVNDVGGELLRISSPPFPFGSGAVDSNNSKPAVYQTDLTRLPPALAPLIERPQWAIWRWTQQDNGRWQKPPFMATQPERHASTKDPRTWADHGTALAAVQGRPWLTASPMC